MSLYSDLSRGENFDSKTAEALLSLSLVTSLWNVKDELGCNRSVD
jgi:hypothetical protein